MAFSWTATILVNATNGAQTVAGTINAATAGEGILNVSDDDAGNSDLITFSGALGGTAAIGTIAVGTAALGGDANFGSTVGATALNITAGNASGENAGGVFVGTATITTLTLTANAADANTDATAEFRVATSALAATTIVLDDASSNGTAELTINTANGATAVTGTINGGSAGEGTLIITDSDSGESDLATISGAVGGTASLLAINIGSATLGADASFSSTVAATTVTITGGNATNENAGAIFAGDATITNLVLVSTTDATTDKATAEFQSALTATAVTLTDAGVGTADVTINATNGAQTIAGTFDGSAASNGTLIVTDDDADAAWDDIPRIGVSLNHTRSGAAMRGIAERNVIDQLDKPCSTQQRIVASVHGCSSGMGFDTAQRHLVPTHAL